MTFSASSRLYLRLCLVTVASSLLAYLLCLAIALAIGPRHLDGRVSLLIVCVITGCGAWLSASHSFPLAVKAMAYVICGAVLLWLLSPSWSGPVKIERDWLHGLLPVAVVWAVCGANIGAVTASFGPLITELWKPTPGA